MNDLDEGRALRSALSSYVPEAPTPPAGFHEGLARARRRRTGARLAAGAVGVAAVLVAAVVVPLAVRGPDAVGPAGPGPSGPSPAALPTSPAEFDLLTTHLTVGWTPPDLPAHALGSSPHVEMFSADSAASSRDGVTVRLYSAGQTPKTIDASRTPAGMVNGQPTWWWCAEGPDPLAAATPPATAPCAVLAWKWATNAWIVVDPRNYQVAHPGLSLTDARTIARRMAQSVRVGAPTKIKLQFGVAGLPADYTVFGAGGPLTSPTSSLSVDTHRPATETNPFSRFLTVDASAARSGASLGGAPTGQVDGVPVRVESLTDSFRTSWSLRVVGYHGLDVTISDVPDASEYGGEQGMETLLAALRVVADPADRSGWTDDVIR